MGDQSHRARLGHVDGFAGLRAVRRAGRRLGFGGVRRAGRGGARAGRRRASEHGVRGVGNVRRPDAGGAGEPRGREGVRRTGRGYSGQQATRPQTLGYGLTDSPAGQAAWIAEKFWAWTDNNGHPEDALSRQTILDEISIYWFTASATSSARLYWESFGSFRDKVTAPSGLSVYPRDITRPSRREAEQRLTDLRWFEEMPRGGHFAALEQPESLVEQVRGFFRLFRSTE